MKHFLHIISLSGACVSANTCSSLRYSRHFGFEQSALHSSFAHNLRRENHSGNFTVLLNSSYFSSDPTNLYRQCLAVVCGQWILRYTSAPADQNPIRGRGSGSGQRATNEVSIGGQSCPATPHIHISVTRRPRLPDSVATKF